MADERPTDQVVMHHPELGVDTTTLRYQLESVYADRGWKPGPLPELKPKKGK